MENSSTRLVVYATLVTLGVILMLLGITWLMFLGLALVMLASFVSSQRRIGARSFAGFMLYAVAAAVILIRDSHEGRAFTQESLPLWFWVLLGIGWLWSIISEFRGWRKSKRLT